MLYYQLASTAWKPWPQTQSSGEVLTDDTVECPYEQLLHTELPTYSL